MPLLYLIRHGQASFGSADYDRLSPLGIQQVEVVGRHLALEDPAIAAVVSGTLRRQIDSGRYAVQALGRNVLREPSRAFNEYDLPALLRAYWPELTKRNPRLAAAREGLYGDNRLYMQALMQAIELWVAGAEGAVAETWQAFHARIHAGLETVLDEYGDMERIAVFTSG